VKNLTKLISLSMLVLAAACAKPDKGTTGPDTTGTPVTPPPPPPPPPTGSGVSIVAAGNIVRCQNTNPALASNANADNTALVVDSTPNATVLALGNAVNDFGTAAAYNGCYNSTWGRFKARTYAAIGNRDYDSTTGNAHGESFNAYFGDRGGANTGGYFSFDLGAWHVVVLNTEHPSGAAWYGSTSAQQAWLQTDLANNAGKKCIMAVFHRARFYSGTAAGGSERTQLTSLWNKFIAGGVDVILNGGQFQYERMAPMNGTGARDDAAGIRQFNIGMGGTTSTWAAPTGIHPNSEKLFGSVGVLKMTLNATSYSWQYVPVSGFTETDTGTGSCH